MHTNTSKRPRPNPSPGDPSIRQAHEETGLSELTIRRYISKGRLRAYRIGPKMIRIERDSLANLASPVGACDEVR